MKNNLEPSLVECFIIVFFFPLDFMCNLHSISTYLTIYQFYYLSFYLSLTHSLSLPLSLSLYVCLSHFLLLTLSFLLILFPHSLSLFLSLVPLHPPLSFSIPLTLSLLLLFCCRLKNAEFVIFFYPLVCFFFLSIFLFLFLFLFFFFFFLLFFFFFPFLFFFFFLFMYFVFLFNSPSYLNSIFPASLFFYSGFQRPTTLFPFNTLLHLPLIFSFFLVS